MSSVPRLYVGFDLAAGVAASLDAEQSNYLARVLRLGEGAPVRLFNGRDGEWTAHIVEAGRKSVTVEAAEQTRLQPAETGPFVHLWFAPVKKARTDFIVEKATELGARSIRPVITARTQSERVRTDRLAKIALEAAEQTERLDLPDIQEPASLTAALAALPKDARLIYCDEAGDDETAPWGGPAGRAAPLAEALEALPKEDAVILIGPEGGFTPEERASLRALENVTPVSLGPRILRAETAALSALAVWQSKVGDWR